MKKCYIKTSFITTNIMITMIIITMIDDAYYLCAVCSLYVNTLFIFCCSWANHGMDFLVVASEPRNVAHLSNEDFLVSYSSLFILMTT